MKRTLALFTITIVLLAGFVSGCASSGGVVSPNPTVDQAQAVRNDAAKLAVTIREAAKAASVARDIAQAAYDTKAISAQVMQAVNNAAIAASNKTLEFITFAESVTTTPSLKQTAAEVLKVFDNYIAALVGAGQTGDSVRAALAALRAYLGVQ